MPRPDQALDLWPKALAVQVPLPSGKVLEGFQAGYVLDPCHHKALESGSAVLRTRDGHQQKVARGLGSSVLASWVQEVKFDAPVPGRLRLPDDLDEVRGELLGPLGGEDRALDLWRLGKTPEDCATPEPRSFLTGEQPS